MYNNLEKKFTINYPEKDSATYTSLLNYSLDLNTPIQRWYRYKEGYSVKLVDYLIKEYNRNPNGTILDPFLGSGTTIIGAQQNGLDAIGFEVNPFSYFLADVKTTSYKRSDISLFKNEFENIIRGYESFNYDYNMPELSISNKVFPKEIENTMMQIREYINNIKNENVKKLLLLGWLNSIEKFSNYRKAGNRIKN